MLQRLYIENFILIESAEIRFQEGLNVITGETGAGKTSLLQALRFALGEKTDVGSIRHGMDSCLVEACFTMQDFLWLHDLGIESDKEITLKRVMHSSGKTKAFINCQMVNQKTLAIVAEKLLEIISQETTYTLRLAKVQTEMLDRFAHTLQQIQLLQQKKAYHGKLKEQEIEMLSLQQKKLREEDVILFQLSELADTELDREEEITQEHEELFKKIKSQDMAKALSGHLQQAKECLMGARQLARNLGVYDFIKISDDQLQEALYTLETKTILDERDFLRFSDLEKKIAKITRLKKKYGPDLASIAQYKKSLEDQHQKLSFVEENLAKLELQIKDNQQIIDELEKLVFDKRQEVSGAFSEQILAILSTLNLQAEGFLVSITSDGAEFWLKNGAKNISIASDVSGGELARITLAIKTVLAENNSEASLFFDEIDAHIGGETALKMAQVLKKMGRYRQVICITHFPQVASCADFHIQVQKSGQKALIEMLDTKGKNREILRMMGGSNLSTGLNR